MRSTATPPRVAREQPVVQRGAHATDVQEARSATVRSGRGPPRPRYRTGRCSSARTSRRAAASGGHPSARSSWAATATRCSPRTRGTWRLTQHSDEDVERFRPLAAATASAYAIATPSTSSTWRRWTTPRSTASASTRCANTARIAAPPRPRRRRLPRRLAPAARARRHPAADRDRHALAALEELGDDAWLLLENSAGAGDTIGRDIERAGRACSRPSTTRASALCIDTCHIYVSGVDIRDRATADAFVERRRPRARPGAPALPARQRQRRAARLEPRPPREHRRGRARPRDRRAARPPARCRACRRSWRRAGPEGKGADRAEIDLARSFHAAALAARASVA